MGERAKDGRRPQAPDDGVAGSVVPDLAPRPPGSPAQPVHDPQPFMTALTCENLPAPK